MSNQDHQPPLNILIVGCSIAGPALATFLLSPSLTPSSSSSSQATCTPHITLLERAPSLRPHGQNIDIRGAGVTLVRKLGLETLVRASTTGEVGVQWVGPDNNVWASLGADKVEAGDKTRVARSTPTADIEIMRGRLAELLYKRCVDASQRVERKGGKGVEFVFGSTLERIEQDGDGIHVWLAEGESSAAAASENQKKRRFDIVVGADGLQSTTRKLTWGEDTEPQRLHNLHFYSAFFSMPPGPTDTMWRRWYHAPGRRGIMVRPDKQRGRTTVFLGVLTETDSRFLDVCAGRSGKGATKSRTELVRAQKALLQETFQDAGWETERVLKGMMDTEDFYYDMVAQLKMERFHKGRVVLLGDAGYCASPFSGMGTTLALTGAYNLAGALLHHANDLNQAFTTYEDNMRPIITKAQKLAPGMPGLFHPETTWGVWALNMFVWLIDVSGIASLLFKLGAGPPANTIPVEDLGIVDFPEMLEG